jgi:hypothetical protein
MNKPSSDHFCFNYLVIRMVHVIMPFRIYGGDASNTQPHETQSTMLYAKYV